MTAKIWKFELPLFGSIAECLRALHAYKSVLQFTHAGTSDTDLSQKADALYNAVTKTEKTLKCYLYQLFNTPTNKQLTAQDVIAASHKIGEAWRALPVSARRDFTSPDGVDVFEDSLVKLLDSPDALQVARKEVRLTAADIVSDDDF